MFLIVCGAGIVMKLMYSSVGIGTILGDFALVANALALIYFAYLIIARPGYERGMLRGAVTIYMVITFIVYYFIHFGASAAMPQQLSVAGYLLYFVSPVMAFIDYLLFCRKGEFTAYSPIPVSYTHLDVYKRQDIRSVFYHEGGGNRHGAGNRGAYGRGPWRSYGGGKYRRRDDEIHYNDAGGY